MIVVSRILLALILLYAGVAKIGRSPTQQLQFLADVLGTRHTRLVRLALQSLPGIEIFIAVSLLLGASLLLPAALVLTVLLGTFTLISLRALRRGVTTPCGCFGRAHDTRAHGFTRVLFNSTLLLVAVYILSTAAREMAPIWKSSGPDLILAAATGFLFASIYALSREIEALFAGTRGGRR